ncbi:MAG TPA: aminopeptidase P family protein [Sphingobacteriaceae bacterium]|nr:aminopeptidase P family protein [Sphingobacteriaceae bacterium]
MIKLKEHHKHVPVRSYFLQIAQRLPPEILNLRVYKNLNMTNSEKLNALRDLMRKENIDAYIIPSADPHISEYLPDRYKSIEWISGFTGSAGILAVTADFAGLWTDSRYFVQAPAQLKGTGFELVKLRNQAAAEYADWLAETLTKGSTVAFDGKLAPIATAKYINDVLEQKEIKVRGDLDLLSKVWIDRPALPTDKAFLLKEKITGKSISQKLEEVRTVLNKNQADFHLISSLDDISWLFNIRGNDVKCNPVVLSFALLSRDKTQLFIDIEKLSNDDRTELSEANVSIEPYESIESAIANIPSESTVYIDPKRNCYAYYELIPKSCKLVEATNPSTNLKAIKNEIELSHTRETMIKDGIALSRFFYWLENNIGKEKITEMTVAAKLIEFRSEQADFVGESFDTIAGYKDHGALPHYKAVPESDVELASDGLLLIDSGGQYKTGTTDITRVISLGNISPEQQKDYTLVLKSMIEGSSAVFPVGTKGYQIDAITRKSLWEHMRNYGHGTGHGVGFFLNVHEGPHTFNTAPIDIAIQPNMVTSIEPGLYREDHYGIRIENLVASHLDEENYFGQFMSFETLTLCFIDTALVDKAFLESKHTKWLNDYNQTVYNKLSPHLSQEEQAWLKEKTKAI